jgi:hypothetical protein
MAAEQHIPLNEAASLIPGRPHLSTLHRWAERGVGGIKLPTIRVGRRRFTTQGDIDRFLAELNKSDSDRLTEAGC